MVTKKEKRKILWARIIVFGVSVILALFFGGSYLIPLPEKTNYTGQEPASATSPNGKFVEANGLLTYVEEAGSPAGTPVVLLHGFAGSTFSWRYTLPVLVANNYRVIAIDLLGFGLAEKGYDLNYAHARQSEFVLAVLDKLNVASAHIVGHSMGANVALYLALTNPERVKKLVLADAALFQEEGNRVYLKLLNVPSLRRWGQIFLQYSIDAETVRALLEKLYYDDSLVTDEIVAGYLRPTDLPAWDETLLAMVRDMDQNVLPANIDTLDKKVLIIWGAEDNLISPEQGYNIQSEIAGSQLEIIPAAGHLVMEEKPDEFNALILKFFGAE